MEKSRKRAIRRAHYQRLKIKRSTHWGYPETWSSDGKREMPEDSRAFLATTSTPCSCLGCGNPRRRWKKAKTRKEALAFFDYVEQCDESGVRPKYDRTQTLYHWW
jgi:hypothetical protein